MGIDARDGGARPGPFKRPGLLLIDLQNGDAHPDSDYVRRKSVELGAGSRERYVSRIQDVVVPNVGHLLAAFRERDLPIIFVRIQSLTADGRDRSPAHRERGIHFPPGSWDGQILHELAPEPDDIVLSKTAASAFDGTGLEELLDRLGCLELIVGGAVTGSCVRATVTDACRVFPGRTHVVDDATATWSEEMQADAIESMRTAGAEPITTLAILSALAVETPARR